MRAPLRATFARSTPFQRTRRIAGLLAWIGALGLAGCAPEGLADRYLAEEAFWDAERYRAAFGGRGIATARPAIATRYRRVVARHAFTPWSEARGDEFATSVNGLRGLARLALARLAIEEAQWDVAGAELSILAEESIDGSPLAVEAQLGFARVAEGQGDWDAALASYLAVLENVTPRRNLDASALSPLLGLPIYLANRCAALGDAARGDSILSVGEQVLSRLRAGAERPEVDALAGQWLTEIYLVRGELPAAARLLEARAGAADSAESGALLLSAARLQLDAGDTRAARRLLDLADSREGAMRTQPVVQRLRAQLLIAEGSTAEGERLLLEMFEQVEGSSEEAAEAGIVLAERQLARDDWTAAAATFGLVEARYPLTAARVDATVMRARLLDEHAESGAPRARARAVEDLLAMAELRPGSRRSDLAEEGAVMLLEELGAWERLASLLESIATRRASPERSAAALLRASEVARRRLENPGRAAAARSRLDALYPGTLAALQSKKMAAASN